MYIEYNAVHLCEFLRSYEYYKNFITFKSYDVTKTNTQIMDRLQLGMPLQHQFGPFYVCTIITAGWKCSIRTFFF